MSILSRAALAGLAVAASASLAFAGVNDFQAGGNGPKQVYKAQLGIKGPVTTVCPNQATMSGWVFTNYAGPIQVMVARKGQGVGQPMVIEARPAANGQYMATFTKIFPIVSAIDAEYRLLVGGGSGVVSNWAPLKASCKIAAGPLNLGG